MKSISILLFLLLFITTLSAQTAISDPITINTMIDNYTDYRIVPIPQAPNPNVLEIPEGGYGYAWFIVEGRLDNVWHPLINANIVAVDAQQNQINAKTRLLPFQFLDLPVYVQNPGVFAVPIPHSMIGNGTPGSQETITIIQVEEQNLTLENRRSITCRIVPYEYTANWSYRLYAKGGGGVTAGVVTATAFAGGGSGASISLDIQGLDNNPEWSALRISRRDDIFVGAKVALGPPRIIDVGDVASATVQASFPYETEYAFNLEEMSALEALMAYYLFAEPSILYTLGANPVGQISIMFLSCAVQVLIANNAHNGLGLARLSDETGLDIEGSINFSVDFLNGLPIALSMGSSLGTKAHLGASTKMYTDGYLTRRMYLGGQFHASSGLGPKIITSPGNAFPNFYPQGLKQQQMNVNMGVDYQLLGTWQNNNWRSIELSSAISSNLPSMNIYNLPGQVQQYSTYLNIDDTAMRNILFNTTQTVNSMWNIGSSSVNLRANNTTFSGDFGDFLSSINQEQSQNRPVQLKYGLGCEDKSSFSIDLALEFPLPPPLTFLVAKLGGGIQATDFRNYNLANGYWVKGYPYLQTEMPSPPQPNVRFADVITGLWDKLTEGNIFIELVDAVRATLKQRFFSWLGLRTDQIELLNDYGSTITITENSIPTDVDSVSFRYWEWEPEPDERGGRLTRRQLEMIRDYNRNLKENRQDALGMRYGIGGFFSFESDAAEWNEAPLLKIVYSDEEVEDIDESTLGVYWEDEDGTWNPITSIAVPDSNWVLANIPYFAVYTLAPQMPYGTFSMSSDPDTLLADGIATADITTETLYNNDGTVVADSTLYTVFVNRGTITTEDANPADSLNIQVPVLQGVLTFTVQSDRIAYPITVTAASTFGNSRGEFEIPQYRQEPPQAPELLTIQPEHRALRMTWTESDDPGIVGYRIHYNNHTAGGPYDGTANVNGVDSPVTVGMTNTHTLTGLNNDDTYFVVVEAVDASGLSSELSNELEAQPVLNAVSNLIIDVSEEGARLTWSPAFGASAYKIYRHSDTGLPVTEWSFVGETERLNWLDRDVNDSMFYVIISVAY